MFISPFNNNLQLVFLLNVSAPSSPVWVNWVAVITTMPSVPSKQYMELCLVLVVLFQHHSLWSNVWWRMPFRLVYI